MRDSTGVIVQTAAPGDDAAPGVFKFEKRNARLDWRLLHSIDVDRIVRETVGLCGGVTIINF